MNDLITAQPSRSCPPSVVTGEFTNLVARLSNKLERTPNGAVEICDAAAPTEPERALIQVRMQELNGTLTSSNEAEVAKRVAFLLAGFGGAADAAAAAMNVKLCTSALTRFPLWVIDEAFRRVRDGVAGIDRAYAPKAPQLAEICRVVIWPSLDERAKLNTILTARTYSLPPAEERDRIAAGLKDLLVDLRKGPAGEETEKREAARRFMSDANERALQAELAAHGITDGRKISVAMRQKLAAMTADLQVSLPENEALIAAARERRERMEREAVQAGSHAEEVEHVG